MRKKYNLLVPIAGRGSRMGVDIPKAMIMAGDKTILEWGMECIYTSECNIIFVILAGHAHNHGLDAFLRLKYPDCEIIQLDEITGGSVQTCYAAKHLIQGNDPLIIFAPDVCFYPSFDPDDSDFMYAGQIVTFKANSPNYSYVLRDKSGFVCETREKSVISQEAALGLYLFKTGDVFLEYAYKMVADQVKTNGEFYICPMYNLMIADGLQVDATSVSGVHIMGTAEELEFFEQNVYPYLNGPIEFVLCSDHSGWAMKEIFKEELQKATLGLNIKITDVGCYSNKDCDYWDFLQLATKRVNQNRGAYGLGFCRSGQGMNIAANKIPGIRSALLHSDQEVPELAIQHNAANFFAIPDRFAAHKAGIIISHLLRSRFEGGRHQNRLMKVGA